MNPSWRCWFGISVLAHATLVAVGYATTVRSTAFGVSSSTIAVEVLLPKATPANTTFSPVHGSPSSPSEDLTATLGGARNAQNLHTRDPGQRGDGRSPESGQLLAVRSDGINLSPDLMNNTAVMQQHRLRTARHRTSPQDRRSTPHPGYDPWIASTDGILLFRVRYAPDVPARGATVPDGLAVSRGSSHLPSPPPSPAASEGHPPRSLGTAGAMPRPNAGIASGTGYVHHVAGPSARGRASIEQGRASTTSEQTSERPQDTVDAEALATHLLRNALATTLHAGPTRAPGRGGVGGGGLPGSGGGQDTGGHARPHGEGEGWISLTAPDERYVRYYQAVRREIDRAWADAFPREEMLRLRQGTVILRFVIEADGRLRDVSIQRRSGIDAFDRNVASAIASVRVPPIPPELGRSEIRVQHAFVFRNPIVR